MAMPAFFALLLHKITSPALANLYLNNALDSTHKFYDSLSNFFFGLKMWNVSTVFEHQFVVVAHYPVAYFFALRQGPEIIPIALDKKHGAFYSGQ